MGGRLPRKKTRVPRITQRGARIQSLNNLPKVTYQINRKPVGSRSSLSPGVFFSQRCLSPAMQMQLIKKRVGAVWGSFSINAIRYVTDLSWPVSDSTLNTPPFGQPCVFRASPPCPDRGLTSGRTPAGAKPSPRRCGSVGQDSISPCPLPARRGGSVGGEQAEPFPKAEDALPPADRRGGDRGPARGPGGTEGGPCGGPAGRAAAALAAPVGVSGPAGQGGRAGGSAAG